MSPHDETLELCEELLASVSAAQAHLRVLCALQLDFSSVLKIYRDALKRTRELLDEAGVPPAALAFTDFGGRDDTDELLSLAVRGALQLEEDTDEREIESSPASVATTIGQTGPNAPAVPIDDGPEGTADVGAPLATDETSSETARASKVLDTNELQLPAEPETSEEGGDFEEQEQAEIPTMLIEPKKAQEIADQVPTMLREPEEGDVFVMEEDEEVATELMTPAQARARAAALAAEEDAAAAATAGTPTSPDDIELGEPEFTEETPEGEKETTEKVPFDEEATVVLEASDLEFIPDDETTQPVETTAEVIEDEPDQGSVDEVILTKKQAADEVEKVKSTPPPVPRASTSRPTPKVKPKVKAKSPAKKDINAKFYAASASIPTIRDESTPKPRAAAIKLGGDGQPAQVLGAEHEDEPIAVDGVEDETLLDLEAEGLTLEVESPWDDWEEEEEEVEEEILELSEEHLEAVPEEEVLTLSAEELDDLLERARRAARQGNIETGVNYFSDVLDADPDRVDAYIGRGRLYLDLGDFSRAMSDFTVAEDLDPESPEPQVAVGDLYFARKDYRKAIEFFDTALAMKPDHAMAFCRRGISHYYRRNYKQALDDLNEAVRLDPDIPNIKTFVSMAKKKARIK